MVGGYIIVNAFGEITAFSGSSNSGGILTYSHTYTPSMCYDWLKRVIDKSVF